MIDGDGVLRRARIAPERRGCRVVHRVQPAVMDQPADDRAGDRLGHRPGRGDTIGIAEVAVTLKQDPIRRGDQDAVQTARSAKQRIQRGGDLGGRLLRLIDRIADRPGRGGVGAAARNRPRLERRRDMPTQQYPAISRARDRRSDDRWAEIRVAPPHGGAAVSVAGLDANTPGLVGDRELRRCGGVLFTDRQTTRHHRRAPAKMILRGRAIEARHVDHVGKALGREVDRAGAQCTCRGVVDDRLRQAGGRAVGHEYWGPIEDCLDRTDRRRGRPGDIIHCWYCCLLPV